MKIGKSEMNPGTGDTFSMVESTKYLWNRALDATQLQSGICTSPLGGLIDIGILMMGVMPIEDHEMGTMVHYLIQVLVIGAQTLR